MKKETRPWGSAAFRGGKCLSILVCGASMREIDARDLFWTGGWKEAGATLLMLAIVTIGRILSLCSTLSFLQLQTGHS